MGSKDGDGKLVKQGEVRYTAKEFAKRCDIPYNAMLHLLKTGYVPNVERGKNYRIHPDAVRVFREKQERSIADLRAHYIDLYWSGLQPEQIQRKVKDDFREKNIFADKNEFVLKTLLEDNISKRGRAAKDRGDEP